LQADAFEDDIVGSTFRFAMPLRRDRIGKINESTSKRSAISGAPNGR